MSEKELFNLIKELLSIFSKKYSDFKGFYLYGSRLKETVNKNSDIDIVAIFDFIDWDKDYEISGIICDLIYKYDVYIDLHTYTNEDLRQNPVYYNEVVNKGQFYEAA